MKAALLVIDVQKAFFEEDAVTTRSLNSAVWYINAAIDVFRKKGLPVISVQHMNEDEKSGAWRRRVLTCRTRCKSCLPMCIFTRRMAMRSIKHLSWKKYTNWALTRFFLTGYCAENCVLSTCRGAEDVDLMPILVRGAIASGSLERIKFVEDINDVISIGALYKVLG